MSAVPGLRERVRGWLRREPRPVVSRVIMVADADRSMREATVRMLDSLGYQTAPLTTLADLRQRLELDAASFVLLGFTLDDSDGLEALDRLHEQAPELPVIMLTPDSWDTRMAEALRRGAVAYLARPFGPDDLREILGRR